MESDMAMKDMAKQEFLKKQDNVRWYYGLYLVASVAAYLFTLIVISL